jgi:menaquinone-9 beta-reductase
MTTDQTDVLVVGAGPGGSAAAYHLARRGVDVLLVDKAVFPRDKVCGDGVTPYGVRAIAKMGIDPLDAGFLRIDGLRTWGTDGFKLDLPWPPKRSFPRFGVTRTRFEFDHLLAMRAEKAGASFLQGVEATEPLVDRGWVAGATLQEGDGETRRVTARYVIAADGVSSRFAMHAGVERDPSRPIAIAARRYYRIPRPTAPMFEAFLNIGDEVTGGLLPSYGWIFPIGDGTINVGVGLLNTFGRFREFSGRKVMDLFISQLPPEWGIDEEHAVGPLASGAIPMGINRRPVAVPGLLVVGDAAGMTNPFNGEGIAYAMETGELAAELIADALTRGRPAIAHLYPKLIRERYGRYFSIGNRWARMLGHPRFMSFAVRHGFPRKRLMEFALLFMANITDGKDGAADDRLMHALVSMASDD